VASDPWTPITRGRFSAEEVDDRSCSIHASLSQEPPADWLTFFNGPTGIKLPADWVNGDGPRVSSATLTIRCLQTDVEARVATVDELIEHANQRYEQEIAPRLQSEEAAREAVIEERVRKTADLEDRLKDL
jgi:hypothetical protein